MKEIVILFMVWKCIKIIYIFIFLNLFLISAHEDDPKHLKNNLKLKKHLIFFKKMVEGGYNSSFSQEKTLISNLLCI